MFLAVAAEMEPVLPNEVL